MDKVELELINRFTPSLCEIYNYYRDKNSKVEDKKYVTKTDIYYMENYKLISKFLSDFVNLKHPK